ncbi:RNA polymerase sigma factor [Pseudenhygromyxa sp. WMMC2535]|uniref:RNA polymerase sigma factor n=1 Tax=Pseudenhygromyxa sp. WMMC2535 TaxID=2712867 RepID=UPI0015569B5E|nr:RNA polymerase sigma factor [Pseudenhygromyxa sp. WMMC2535]NVB39056.1 RNA polymerase sigma factor [Pseudenhygromyxa sp. WMMC2535]
MASGVPNIDPVEGDGLAPMQSLTVDNTELAPGGTQASLSARPVSPVALEERQLLARAKAGDERALRSIYERHQHQVRCHIHRLLGSDSEVDDLVQIVFSRAFAAIDQFEGKAAISTWLYRITANTTHNTLRQRFRRERMRRAMRLFDLGRGADRVSAGHLEAGNEAQRILEGLHPDLRQIFVLYHYQGLTLQEISDVVERPVSTVGDRLNAARKKLRELVSED